MTVDTIRKGTTSRADRFAVVPAHITDEDARGILAAMMVAQTLVAIAAEVCALWTIGDVDQRGHAITEAMARLNRLGVVLSAGSPDGDVVIWRRDETWGIRFVPGVHESARIVRCPARLVGRVHNVFEWTTTSRDRRRGMANLHG